MLHHPSVTVDPAAHAAAPPYVLHACDLAGQRGERALFEHLDLALEPGAVVWLRGRNGRGKTTLLRLLAGLASPTAGEVCLAGCHGGRPDRQVVAASSISGTRTHSRTTSPHGGAALPGRPTRAIGPTTRR